MLKNFSYNLDEALFFKLVMTRAIYFNSIPVNFQCFYGFRVTLDCTKTAAVESPYLLTYVVCSIPIQAKQYYVIKFVTDLWQASDFNRVLLFPPPIELTAII